MAPRITLVRLLAFLWLVAAAAELPVGCHATSPPHYEQFQKNNASDAQQPIGLRQGPDVRQTVAVGESNYTVFTVPENLKFSRLL